MIPRGADGGTEIFSSFYYKNEEKKVTIFINGEKFTCLDYIDGEKAQNAFLLKGANLLLKKEWEGDAGLFSRENKYYVATLITLTADDEEEGTENENIALVVQFKAFDNKL